jgi:tetratricopeptide (TPR) repeat protein
VQALGRSLVFAKVNGWEDTLLAQTWGISGYPTLILMTAAGEEVDRIPGFAPPDDFRTQIDDFLAGRGTLADLLARWKASPDSLSLLAQVGDKYQYRAQRSQAESCYTEVVSRDPDHKFGLAAKALHSMAVVAYGAGRDRYDTAMARFQAVIDRYPGTEEALDAATWVPYIMAKLERYDEALARFEQFKVDHPESSEIDWVNRQIEEIQKKKGAQGGA